MNPDHQHQRSRKCQEADRAAEYATTSGAAPFSLYTEGRNGWDAPRLTLPGKVPHRMASGVVR